MNEYDKSAIAQIHSWKNPEIGFLTTCVNALQKPIDAAGEAVMSAPYVGDAITKATSGLINVLSDFSAYTVQPDKIIEDFKKAGHPISSVGEIKKLKLEDIDRVIGFLGAKYKGLALTEGVAAGSAFLGGPFVAAAAIAVDIPAITSLCLRAIAEYATHYGYDINSQKERIFLLNVLNYSSTSTDLAKQVALANLTKIAVDVAKKKAWKDLNEYIFVKLIQELAKAIGVRLTKAKLAQLLPGASVFIAAGYNTYLITKTCDAAYMLYRERFLAEYYNNPNIIEETVPPAEEIDFAIEE